MGHPKFHRKTYETPKRPWDKQRLEEERKLMRAYGLRRKHELWKHASFLRNIRRTARELLAKHDKEKEKALLKKLYDLGLLEKNAKLEDVLNLTIEDILKRRLQTIVYQKGFATSIKHARQLVAHKHVKVNDRIVAWPSYLVKRNDEVKVV